MRTKVFCLLMLIIGFWSCQKEQLLHDGSEVIMAERMMNPLIAFGEGFILKELFTRQPMILVNS